MTLYEAEAAARLKERQIETAKYIIKLREINEAEAWYKSLPEERRAILGYYFKDNTKNDMLLYIAKDKNGTLDILHKVEANIRELAISKSPAPPTQTIYHKAS